MKDHKIRVRYVKNENEFCGHIDKKCEGGNFWETCKNDKQIWSEIRNKRKNVKVTKNDFKVYRFTNTNKEDVKMINVKNSIKYDCSGD